MPTFIQGVREASAGAMGGNQERASGDVTPLDTLERVKLVISGLAKTIAGLGAAAVAPTAILTTMGKVLQGFVEMANPVVAEQFSLAVRDMMAVIGQGLVPLFQTVFIPVVRAAGDALMQLAPAGTALAAALQPLVPLITDLFAGAIGILAEAVQTAAPFIMAFARVVADVARFISNSVRELLALVGLELPGSNVKPGASVGAAVRQAGHSSVEDVVKKAQQSALSLGTAAADPMSKLADATAAMKARADQIYEFIQQLPAKIWEFIKQLPSLIAEAIRNLPNSGIGRALTQPDSPEGKIARGIGQGIPGGEIGFKAWDFGRQQFQKPGLFGFTSVNPWSK